MADNATIARPYAKAVFDYAQESNSFDEWTTVLDQLAAISAEESFNVVANDPRVEDSKITQLLVDLTKDVLPNGGTNFITLLVQNERLDSLVDVKQQYAELVAKAKAIVTAQVTTAIALTQDQKSSLISALEKRLDQKVVLEETVNADLIGGAIVKTGDLVIDGTAKGRIEKLTTALSR